MGEQKADLSWMNSWINTENEGSLCFLSLPNTQDGWILNDENFSCGSSGVLILMCDKAFKLLEKASVGFLVLMVIASISLLMNLFLVSYILNIKNQKPSKIVKKIPQKRMRYSWQKSKQSDRNPTKKVSKEIVPELQPLKPPLEVKVILKNEQCS